MARCLVLGANGFIGGYLVNSLLKDGHFVRCFDRYKSTDLVTKKNSDLYEIFSGDFLNKDSLDKSLENIQYVFHFISTTNPISSENDPIIDIETNIKMSVELFDLCVKHKVKKVIFPSTGGAIYGNQKFSKPILENMRPLPISPYAIGKLTIENYLRYFKKKYSLDYLVLRISNPFGPKQNVLSGQGVIPTFLSKIKFGENIEVYGDGSMVRDYIYIEDVSKMIVNCFLKKSSHSTYNIGFGKGYSINNIIKKIEEVTGKKITRNEKKVPDTFVDKITLDTTRYRTDFGDVQLTSLEEGIKKTWDYVRNHD